MRINTNIAALNSYNQLKNTDNAMTKSLERLSSGKRINRAADDAAGLAISEKMKTQINGLGQAQRNAQDGISMIQTAEGALKETHSILQRMRELSVQASNDTNTADDRAQIQEEIDQLTTELDRISETTEFNTKKLLNGNIGAEAKVTGGSAGIDEASVEDASLDSGTYTVNVSSVSNVETTDFVDGGTGLASSGISMASASADFGQYQVTIEEDSDNAGKATVTLKNAKTNEVVGSQDNVDIGSAGGGETVSLGGFSFDLTSGANTTGSFTFEAEGDFSIELQDSGGNVKASKRVTDYTENNTDIGGLNVEFNADISSNTSNVTVMSNSVDFQIGANEGQTMSAAVNDMSSEALGVSDVDVTNDAESAIGAIDDAINQVSTQRSKLGAVQNRLDHTINNLGAAEENLTAANSRIRDVDMAKEMMNLSRTRVLRQAGTAMLAQANQKPQGVMQLLG